MNLKVFLLILNTDRPITQSATMLRGFVARRFPEQPILHQHIEERGLIYLYPKVQYRVIDGMAMMVGLAEGAEVVKEICSRMDCLEFGGMVYQVKDKQIQEGEVKFGENGSAVCYHFLTPWLALNEKNYERYKTLDRKGQIQLLNRILIGNILSMAKGLEYVVTSEIRVRTYLKPTTIPAKIKGVGMTGFLGEFQVNFNLPDYIGLGKSVSRGFGTIKKVGS